MANGNYNFDEIRFDVRDQQQTHVYVYISADHNCPHTVQGWYHKQFPATRTTQDILTTMFSEDRGILFWEKSAPKDVVYTMYNGPMGLTHDVTPRQG